MLAYPFLFSYITLPIALDRNGWEATFELIRSMSYFFLPLLCSIVLVPIYIYPESFENFRYHFIAKIFTKEYCEFRPDDCVQHISWGEDVGKPLRVTMFPGYDLIYVRHHLIERIEKSILNIFTTPTVRETLLFLKKYFASPTANNEKLENSVLWSRFLEKVHVMIAIFMSMLYDSIRGIFFSKMWIFLSFGVILTLIQAWSPVMNQLKYIARKSNNVF